MTAQEAADVLAAALDCKGPPDWRPYNGNPVACEALAVLRDAAQETEKLREAAETLVASEGLGPFMFNLEVLKQTLAALGERS